VGHEYGYVDDFVDDYNGSVKYGQETVGWKAVVTHSDGSTNVIKSHNSQKPKLLLDKNSTVKYYKIFKPYAIITIGTKSAKFDCYAPSFTKMERTDFLKDMVSGMKNLKRNQ
jgi:hypothetical protein